MEKYLICDKTKKFLEGILSIGSSIEEVEGFINCPRHLTVDQRKNIIVYELVEIKIEVRVK